MVMYTECFENLTRVGGLLLAKVAQLLKIVLCSETAISTNAINIHNSTLKQKNKYTVSVPCPCSLLSLVSCAVYIS